MPQPGNLAGLGHSQPALTVEIEDTKPDVGADSVANNVVYPSEDGQHLSTVPPPSVGGVTVQVGISSGASNSGGNFTLPSTPGENGSPSKQVKSFLKKKVREIPQRSIDYRMKRSRPSRTPS